jgi:hypothetical protein
MRLLVVLVAAAMIPVSLYACTEDAGAPTQSTYLDGSTIRPLDGSGSTVVDTGAPAPDASDSGPDGAKPEGGTAVAEAGSDADADAAPASNGTTCTQAEFDAVCGPTGGDCTGATAQINVTFPNDAIPVQYTNRCVKVKVGTDIDFAGDFVLHPLEPAGGDVPTPIPTQTANPPVGGSGLPELVVKMTAAGTYGFHCVEHPTVMAGAIQVVP